MKSYCLLHELTMVIAPFPVLKRKDEAKHGEYRTKRVILEIYDEMAQARKNGVEYQTRLEPPQGES